MIPIYSLCTPSHQVLKERFWLPTVPAGFEARVHEFENEGEGQIADASYCRAIVRKVEVILQAIDENWGEPFVWSDIDLQFFAPFEDWVERVLERFEIAFQVDAPGPVLCSGFFFCRGGAAVRKVWADALSYLKESEAHYDDQKYVRENIWGMKGLRAGYLPLTFAGGGTFSGTVWDPGMKLEIPEGMMAHHANFTIGVANKIAMCGAARDLHREGRTIGLAEARARMRKPERLSF